MKAKLYFILFFFLIFSKFTFAQSIINNRHEAKKTLQKAIDELNKLNCKSSLDNAQKVLEFALKNDEDSFSAKAYNIIGLNYEEFSDLKISISNTLFFPCKIIVALSNPRPVSTFF